MPLDTMLFSASIPQVHRCRWYEWISHGLWYAGTWTEREIKKAFQKQALLWHPDHHGVAQRTAANGERKKIEDMRARFQWLREAYEVLRDPQKKKRYDRGEFQRHEI